VPAAGSSSRMELGKHQPQKVLYSFSDGESVLEKSLNCLNQAGIKNAVIATSANILEEVKELVSEKALKNQAWNSIEVIEGGSTRFESVRNSLNFISSFRDGRLFKVVTIHDAARPFCNPNDIVDALRKVSDNLGVVLGVPVVNTIKVVDDNQIIKETLDRNMLFEIQTPQSFPFAGLLKAYENSSSNSHFDDSQVFENDGGKVLISVSSRENLKLTYSSDLLYFEHILKELHPRLPK